jgi:iron complex transport system substrate-binding protein
MQKIFSILGIALFLFSCSTPVQEKQEKEKEAMRIVSLSGTLTEIIYALHAEKELVGVDVTSTYPEKATKLTNLGHIRMISAEGILGLTPTHVIGFKDEFNPTLVDQLKKANIEVVLFDREFTIAGAKQVIRDCAKWLDQKVAGEELVAKIDADVKGLEKLQVKPSVLFIYARGVGTMMVAGDDSQFEKMIELAGGKNAVTGFVDFKPLTTESLVAANPDILLMFDSGASSLNGEGGIFAVPGVSMTTAGKQKRLITMDGQLLSGFGPRVGEALQQLNKAFSKLAAQK